ncbi:MAG: DUF2203 domain-containing protein [Acidobacteriia bacterium]|nr:DUF2203 domain-containing protein [Terriglobia bacterium]
MAKRFTLEEAQRLLSSLDPLLRKAIQRKSAYAAAEQAVKEFSQRILVSGGMLIDRDQVIAARNQRDAAAAELRSVLEEVQEFGCVVKDLDIGLLDFPTMFRGREVYLCWKLGEPSISWWHGTDEGFAGRKSIDQDFREHHKGDPTH